ncbi:transcriptional regulator [Paucilactobacillus hokkaidonensis JCM 18461]|uniref:Transcriptional regulator n=2 Tax=Paucilactobacillus hokkaidonensis TaxID=1193095 RepID=A0A0A1GUX1_9LACO|nr:MarR family transcriptional regulator [Paucilactobacillus hokkaidonensis]KRO10341.1 transcriptional regulator [Paucilactobacillus hokkaidonensis]BAP85795.1 transcriptional regulator [Paucilactobacillus hokkaidonensis JCM 18461]
MTDQTTQLLAAIRTAQQQHERFKVGFWQFALNNLASEIPAAIITQFESLKMTHSEMEILSQLTTFKTNLVPYKTLQAQVSFSQGMFSRYINRLAKTELITKTKQPDNKKEVLLTITQTGRYVAKLHTRMHQLEQEHNEAVLAQFSKDEVQTTIKVLNSLNSNETEL